MKKGWLVFLVLLAAAALTLSGILLGKFSREEKIFQEQAALNGIVYDEAFLEEAAKLPGIQSVKPVVSLPVQLKVGEYSVETELLGVDANGHAISEKRLGQLLEEYQELSITASFSNQPEQTFSCRAAAVLKEPADKIYFSIDQAKALAEQYGQPFSIKEVLLTVKGETNFRKAKESFVPTKEGL